jgi:hypothetical protein
MELRDHPLMSYRGARNWPPTWIPVDREINRMVAGEVGILRNVEFNARYNCKCRLVIEHGGEAFAGTLEFDNTAFCWFITNILKNHTRRAIEDIVSLELSFVSRDQSF